ncbi:MAG: hypothetical protein ACI9J2_000753 [Saprospiraceae bacterium]|jgi:hypothetical protein
METFDWHKNPITKHTPIDNSYKHTQNVCRFFKLDCGQQFRFDRNFMQWMKQGQDKTMGDAVAEWIN